MDKKLSKLVSLFLAFENVKTRKLGITYVILIVDYVLLLLNTVLDGV